MENKKTVFDELFHLDVNERVEKKKTGNTQLSYLSWSWAWAEVKKRFENATYIIHKFENNLPYVYDENTGYMVFTSVTIDGITHEMWLPVMDGTNKAMKSTAYTYSTKYNGEKTVEPASMFDINKTIMRCLVKNLAMFGLGLYIYSGEDLPEEEPVKQANDTQKDGIRKLFERLAELTQRPFDDVEKSAMGFLKLSSISTDDINVNEYGKLIAYLQPTVAKFEMKQKEKQEEAAKKVKKEKADDTEQSEQEGLPLEYPQAK
jgi:hypothetical protein